MAKSKFYLTTAIDYVNGDPHIGHAAEKVEADALARWHRLCGDDVFFLTGTDENTMKLIKAADKEGLSPKKLADKYTARFQAMADTLNVSYSAFIRTSDEKAHHPGAQQVWKLLDQNGYIYKGRYEGLYCVECEQFYTEKELIDGKCPEHGIPLEKRSEENYLFKLSAFTDRLKDLIKAGSIQILPDTRRNEILAFLEEGLEDISFSRPADKLTMGVPVPGDDSQRMYVWCDALTNYITGIGYGHDEREFDTWWPADLHIIGKGILRFHAAIWPAMLLGAGLKTPKAIFVHSYFTLEGEKISKSAGNVINPVDLVEQHGVDPIRYYLVKALPYASDGDYSQRHFTEIYNAELANDLGNLANRILSLVEQKCDGKVPKGSTGPQQKDDLRQRREKLASLMDECRFAEALEHLNAFVGNANRFIGDVEPYKQTGDALNDSLYTLVQLLGHLSLWYQPFIPEAAEKLQGWLGLNPVGWNPETLAEWEKVKPGTKVTKGDPLFPKT